jgi:hypothetical protein
MISLVVEGIEARVNTGGSKGCCWRIERKMHERVAMIESRWEELVQIKTGSMTRRIVVATTEGVTLIIENSPSFIQAAAGKTLRY